MTGGPSQVQTAFNLRTTDRIDMDVDIFHQRPEHPVLIPVGLTYPQ
jgi:hypothetical protein